MARPPLVILACLVACLFLPTTRAVIFLSLQAPQDDPAIISQVQEERKVIAFRGEVQIFAQRLLQWKERDFRALFGKPVSPREGEYAMMCTEARVIGLSGIRY